MAISVTVVLALILFQPESAGIRRLFEERHARDPNADSARDLGLYLARHNDPAAARPLLTEALRLSNAASDALELALLSSVTDAEPLLLRAAKDPKIAPRAYDALGHLYDATGNRTAAATAYRKASPNAATLEALAQDVPPLEGIPLLRQALVLNRRNLGARHPQTATTLANLAAMLLANGRAAEAIEPAREALAIFRETLGPENSRTTTAASILELSLRRPKAR